MGQSRVRVLNLAGDTVLECTGSDKVLDVKRKVESKRGTPPRLQRILLLNGVELADGDVLAPLFSGQDSTLTLLYLHDESPVYSWDIAGNPDSALLSGGKERVEYVDGPWDYVIVITREPVMSGVWHFEFVMHKIGGEQWCGVRVANGVVSGERAGHYRSSTEGWYYYCGRRGSARGELHARRERRSIAKFAHVGDGDRIGLLLDSEEGLLAFSLNGQLQGACRVPFKPLYLSTALHTLGDSVELRRLPLEDFPARVQELVPIEDSEDDEDCESSLSFCEMDVPLELGVDWARL